MRHRKAENVIRTCRQDYICLQMLILNFGRITGLVKRMPLSLVIKVS
jgi:hypothetical protein